MRHAPLRNTDTFLICYFCYFLDGFCFGWEGGFDEAAIRELRPAFFAPGHTEDFFDARIKRGQIFETDRPVITRAVDLGRFEFIVTQAEGLARPKQ